MTQEQIKALTEIVSDELLKRGFIVKLDASVSSLGRIKITSDNFQTTPVLYKKLYIEGGGQIKSEVLGEDDIKYSVCLRFNVRVETFSGGYNGTDLFYLNLSWFNDYDRIKQIIL